ncbi:radical SAM protein [Candidatus Gracilibacteria bacterium 28_42_T64]|nr:radical SAM protein [Candidatus Gracilibacteria bacterium 28_42_T64]
MIYGAKRLLFRLGKGCNTGCTGCSDNYTSQTYYDMSELKKNIATTFQVFNNDCEIFCFGVDPLLYGDIDELMLYIHQFDPKGGIAIQISDINIYKPGTYKILAYLLQKYNIQVYVSTSISNLNTYNFKSLVRLLEFFLEDYIDNISFQIYYKKKIELIESKNFRLLTRYKQLKLSISEALQIDNDNEIVTSEDVLCKYHNSFLVKNNDIIFEDFDGYYDLEISINGDIRPHIPRCYLADLKISNIFFDNEKRIFDFNSFKSYLNSVNNEEKTFEHNCYKCIIKGKYSYQ